jgi:phosphomannomutase/phosphoglucomutase
MILGEKYDLARAIAYYFIQRNAQTKHIVVGIDGRHHSEPIKEQVCQGLLDSGLNVLYAGICPSPVIYFAMHTMNVDGGLVITASHNPKDYNGIKICFGKEAVWGEEIKIIQQLFLNKSYHNPERRGVCVPADVISLYVAWLSDHFKHLKGMNLKMLIDCGNGTAGAVLPQLIKQMSWSHVLLLYPEIDGNYPNHEPDPTVEKNMADVKKLLMNAEFDLGAGLDGDCDRMAAMTKFGVLIPGDQLLALFAYPIIKKHPGSVIVFDVKASSALMELLELWGAHSVMSPTGHALIKDSINKHKAILGGELSCHFFFNDRYFGYDDGIYALLRLCEIIIQSKESLYSLLSVMPVRFSSPEYRIEWDEDSRGIVVDTLYNYFKNNVDAIINMIDGIRVTLPYGWGLARLSNTQSVVSMRFESKTAYGLRKIKHDFAYALADYKKNPNLEILLNE